MHPLLRRRLIGFLGCGGGAVSIAIGLVGKRGVSSGGDVQLGVVVLLVGLAFAFAGFADEEGIRRVRLASVVALLGVIVGGIVGTIIGQFQHPSRRRWCRRGLRHASTGREH